MPHSGKTFRLSLLAGALFGVGQYALADTTLEAVVVQSDKDDFEMRQHVTSTKLVYGREELDRMNELTVGDYLRRLPGVTFTGPPGNPADVRLRGMDKGYTQILIDGEPVASGTKERQLQVDRLSLDMVERIEIIRAPTADLSNEGLMGTINIVLREIPGKPVRNARVAAGRVFGEKADMDTWNLSGQLGDGSGDVRWLLNASVGSRGTPKTKDKDEVSYNTSGAASGKAKESRIEFEDERTRSDGIDFSPRLNVKLGGDELVFTPWLSRTEDDKWKRVDTTTTKYSYNGSGVLTGTTVTPTSKTEDEDKLRQTARVRGEWKHKLDGGGKLSLYAAMQRGGEEKDKTALEYNNAGALTKTTLEHDDKDEREWYAGARLERKFGGHKWSAGLEYRDKSRQDEKTKLENGVPKAAGRGDSFDIDEKRWNAFLQDEIAVGGGHFLTPGVRAMRSEQAGVDGLGQTSGGTVSAIDPSLHYLWQVDGRNNLRASLTRTLKPPKFDELSPVTETKSGTLSDPDKSGNPELTPETAWGLELGWEHFLPRAGGVLGANLFARNIEDKVENRTALESSGRYVERPQNVGDAKVWGLELDARPRMDIIGLPGLMLRFNHTRLYSELTDSKTGLKTRIKDQPPYTYNVGFDWQLPAWEAAWGVNYNYTPRFVKNPAETTKLDPEAEQKLLDLYVMKRLNRALALRFTAANLLDMKKVKDKYEFTGGGLVSKHTLETEQGGRGFFLALEGKW